MKQEFLPCLIFTVKVNHKTDWPVDIGTEDFSDVLRLMGPPVGILCWLAWEGRDEGTRATAALIIPWPMGRGSVAGVGEFKKNFFGADSAGSM